MSEISFGTLKALQETPYAKRLALALLTLLACTLLSVVAGQAGAAWLTVLLGIMAYAALGAALVTVRRMVVTYRRRRGRTPR
ncbi:hypothetical protein [Sphaerisporangium sp. TRM90804]|uniref:hypothetical protein n=1 Tax=Sphaerisporangium sp. TRM90804 TaxID=3031113 RepID=UPI00244A7559|nr:hypothetical protein [Sphaerisporangium sp. TRM90804]MDH2427507.1 hypothetical protein [Sphaerisporangium sp. TRM90804]